MTSACFRRANTPLTGGRHDASMTAQTRPDPNRRAVLLGASGAAMSAGAFAIRRYGLIGRYFNPLSAGKFDLPAVPGLTNAAGAPIPGFSAGEIAGETVYLNAFASWCPNCRDEHPALMEFAASGAKILGVASLDDPANTLDYLQKHGNPFTKVGVDRKGHLYLALGARGIPASFVMAPAPRLALKLEGSQTLEQLRGKILPLLKA